MQTLPKNHIWKVHFDSEFISSSGMEPYTIKHHGIKTVVATASPSVEDVRTEIHRALPNGERVVKLHKATYLGHLINQ